MDSVEQAEQGFLDLGFRIHEHQPYVAPIGDADEIGRLEARLAASPNDPLARALLEHELQMQKSGQEELLWAVKTFEIFRSLPGDVRPIMQGFFVPDDGKYFLRFTARDLESDTHPLRNAGKLSFKFSSIDDENLASALSAYLSSQQQRSGLPALPAGVILKSGVFSIELSPHFTVYSDGSDLRIAYANLASAIRSLGYDMNEL